jgi:hypothetical protein
MRVPPTSRRIPLQRLHIERIAFALSNDWRALNHVHREVQVDVVGVEFWVLFIGEVFCLLLQPPNLWAVIDNHRQGPLDGEGEGNVDAGPHLAAPGANPCTTRRAGASEGSERIIRKRLPSGATS